MKRFNTITGIVDTGLIASTVITGGISIAAFASDVGLPVGIALSGTSLLLSLATAITRKSFKIFSVKQEKHNAIKLLAQSKLDTITNIISQAMQDGNQAKAKVKEITKERQEEILEQAKKEGKEDFLQKIAYISGTQGVSTI